jgi:hypothetical protein
MMHVSQHIDYPFPFCVLAVRICASLMAVESLS